VDFALQLLGYVNLAGAIHALIQALVLFLARRGDRRANRAMGFFLLALAVGMSNSVLMQLDVYDLVPAASIPMGAIALAFGPLFFFYIRATTSKGRLWKPADALHAIPFVLGLAAYAAYLKWQMGGAAPPGLFAASVRTPWRFVLALSTVQTIAYVAAIIRCLRAYSRGIKANFSTIERVRLGWLRRGLAVYAAIWGVGVGLIAAFQTDPSAVRLVSQIIAFLSALNTFAMGYRAMLQPDVYFGSAEAGPRRRYERSSLTPEDAAACRARLLERMERDRLYLDPEITLPRLAQALEVPPAHLSQVLNDLLGRNFYEFVNGYRVEAARRRLSGPDAGRDKLIAVALDCGFNSLATFNRVFKEMSGRTPSEFRKSAASRLPS
jgi:AraC-like DNA-binding protein